MDEERLAQLDTDLMAANWAFQRFLEDLRTEFSRMPLAQEKLFHLAETQGLMADLRELGSGTVALYTLVGEEKYRVLLITPDVQLAREVPISAADLRRKVGAFREQLAAVRFQTPPPDPRPLAHELYRLLVGPIAQIYGPPRLRSSCGRSMESCGTCLWPRYMMASTISSNTTVSPSSHLPVRHV